MISVIDNLFSVAMDIVHTMNTDNSDLNFKCKNRMIPNVIIENADGTLAILNIENADHSEYIC